MFSAEYWKVIAISFLFKLGYFSGAVLGAILLFYIKDYGLDLSAFSDALEMWGYESIIYGTIMIAIKTTNIIRSRSPG